MKNNLSALSKIKSDIGKESQNKFISQEKMIALISDASGVKQPDVYSVMLALAEITAQRLNAKEDVLIPGIIRLAPGEGGLTRRYVKIQSISRYLKDRLK